MLIYKPARQFMTPNNVPIDPAVENEFELTVGGQICKAYRFSIFDMENNKVEDASTGRIALDSPLYYGDILKHKVSAGKLVAGNAYKWQMDLYANDVEFSFEVKAKQYEVASFSSTSLNYLTLADTSVTFENGTEIHFECEASLEAWPNNIAADKTYFLRKCSSTQPAGSYYLYSSKEYATKSSTSTTGRIKIGGGTLPSTGEKFYMVQGTFASEMSCSGKHNFSTGDVVFVGGDDDKKPSAFKDFTPYYVRSINTNTIKLYDNIEGARNDAGGVTIKNGSKAIVSNIATSEQVVFTAYNEPSFILPQSEIHQKSHVFVPQYSHPQEVMINNWTATVRTADSDDYDTSGTVYKSKVEYEYDGMISGITYYVRFDAETNVGQKVSTGYVAFTPSYDAPQIDIAPTAKNDEFSASIAINWAGLVSVPGELSTGHAVFVDDFVVTGNKALDLQPGQTLTFNNVQSAANSMPPRFWWSPNSSDFTGPIMRAKNTATGESLEIGYDGDAFYTKINNIKRTSVLRSINSEYAYLIGFVDEILNVFEVGLREGR